MERYTIEQRVKVIQAYYENGRSNQNAYRALRDFFGQFNRPNVRTVGKIVQKFEQTGSVGDVKTPVHARTARTAENIAAVRDSVAEEPSTSIRRRAQQLHLSRSSLMNIMQKDLHLHANKIPIMADADVKIRDRPKKEKVSESPTKRAAQSNGDNEPPAAKRGRGRPPTKQQSPSKKKKKDSEDEEEIDEEEEKKDSSNEAEDSS